MGNATKEDLAKRGFTLIVDRSGSMSTRDAVGNKSRWVAAHEGTVNLARKIEEINGGLGLDALYTFSSSFDKYHNVKAEQVEGIWAANEPNGGTALHLVLEDALNSYFKAKANGTAKEGEIIVVITDGEPDDQQAVAKVLVNATKKIDRDEELGIEFIQLGHDKGAKAFLDALDNELTEHGAKYDIVNTVTQEQWEGKPLMDVLLSSLND